MGGGEGNGRICHDGLAIRSLTPGIFLSGINL
jgi:hypothetical protein